MKIDPHIHSVYSNRQNSFVLRKAGSFECYTTPKSAYDTCLNRGMDMVTISDHDTIEGALEIADLPGAFMSEEVTALFPEDQVSVHVLTLDITEAQHVELQRLRENIYDLVAFMRAETIPHILAHPLSKVKKALAPSHIQRLMLMFKHLEVRNGTRDKLGGFALQRLVRGLTPQIIDEWANIHDIKPVDDTCERFFTGGSDDHGRLNIARAYTDFDFEEKTTTALREAFFAGKHTPGGVWGSPDAISHSIYAVTFKYFQRNSSKSALSDILDFTDEEESLKGGGVTYKDRRVEIAKTIQQTVESFPQFSPFRVIEKSHTDDAQAQIGELGRKIVNNMFKHFVGGLIESIESINLEQAFDRIPGVFTASSVILPYIFGYRYIIQDRNASEQLVADLGFGYSEEFVPKTAIFLDSGYQTNGVSLGLRRMIIAMRKQGNDVDLVVSEAKPEGYEPDELEKMGALRAFEPVGEFALPVYKEVLMGIPSVVDVLDYLSTNNVAVVQLSTPGPLGLVAYFAAKLLGIKIVANYHTEFPRYTAMITGDDNITKIMTTWTSWFFRQAERVIVPSKAAAASLEELNIDEKRVHILPRGIDISRFDVSKRDEGIWKKLGVNDGPKLLYVGRVSREKEIDVLLGAFAKTKEQHTDLQLVIAGDGPYFEELGKIHASTSGVNFLGYIHGDDLLAVYASADVFVFPSPTDTFGNVVIEAQASGLPAVVVDQGGPAEQITQGENGFIVKASNVDQMAEAVGKILSDSSLKERMGKAARASAQLRSIEKAAQAQWDFYMDTWGHR